MIDTLLNFRDRAKASMILSRINVEPRKYAVVTLHRPSNVDDPRQLCDLLSILELLAERIPVVFPMHPRTQKMMAVNNLKVRRVQVLPPQGYIDFLRLISDARLVVTDSGGIQEETTILV